MGSAVLYSQQKNKDHTSQVQMSVSCFKCELTGGVYPP